MKNTEFHPCCCRVALTGMAYTCSPRPDPQIPCPRDRRLSDWRSWRPKPAWTQLCGRWTPPGDGLWPRWGPCVVGQASSAEQPPGRQGESREPREGRSPPAAFCQEGVWPVLLRTGGWSPGPLREAAASELRSLGAAWAPWEHHGGACGYCRASHCRALPGPRVPPAQLMPERAASSRTRET